MKRGALRTIAALLLVAMIAVGIFSFPIIAEGYAMYKSTIGERSLEDTINGIRSKDNYIELKDVPEGFVAELIKSEDKRFYQHPGVDPISTVRATYHSLKEKAFVEGGSTITQQVAKNLYFSFDKKLERKVAEVLVALELERTLTKDEILELYLNIAYFGEGCYGLKDAAGHYYGTAPKSLTSNQSSALVFTLKRPNDYNPNAYQRK